MCEHCKPNKQALSKPGHPHEFIIDDGAIFYYDSMDGWEGEKIDYCPMCGRRLTPEEPLTLEELKQMDGEPVWVWFASDLQRWGLVDIVNKCVSGFFSTVYFNTYEEKWFAYHHKPIEEEH